MEEVLEILDPHSPRSRELQNGWAQEIKANYSKEVVEVNYFGRSEIKCVWVTQDVWRSVSVFVKKKAADSEVPVVLESLFAFSVDSSVILTLGLRDLIFLRCSVTSGSVSSLSDIWQGADFFENEIKRQFNVQFLRSQ